MSNGIKLGDRGVMVNFLKKQLRDFNNYMSLSDQWDTATQQNFLDYIDMLNKKYNINLGCFLNSSYSKILDNHIIYNEMSCKLNIKNGETVRTEDGIATYIPTNTCKLIQVEYTPEAYTTYALKVKLGRQYFIYTQNTQDNISIGLTLEHNENYTDNFVHIMHLQQCNLNNEFILDLSKDSTILTDKINGVFRNKYENTISTFSALNDLPTTTYTEDELTKLIDMYEDNIYMCYQLPSSCKSFIIFDVDDKEAEIIKNSGGTYCNYYNIDLEDFGTQSIQDSYVIVGEIFQYLLDTAISPLSEEWRIVLLKDRLRALKDTPEAELQKLSYNSRLLRRYLIDTNAVFEDGYVYDDTLKRVIFWFGSKLNIKFNLGYVTTELYKYLFPDYNMKGAFL